MSSSPVILITGASSGIGAASARLFSREGYRVVLAARRLERLEALVAEIQAAGGQAFAVRTDLCSPVDIHMCIESAHKEMGQVDILFNNAGFGRMGWLEELEPEFDIETQLQVNLHSLIEMTRLVLPIMKERRKGHIINMCSIAGLIGTPTYSVYAASKFGVRGFSEALRREVRSYGVKVSVIYPGGAETEFAEKMGARRKTGLTTPSWLRLSSEEVAMAVLQLARRPKRGLIIPWQMKPVVWMNLFFPGFFDWLVDYSFVRKERARP
jgi:short-subunit dehydrogenase